MLTGPPLAPISDWSRTDLYRSASFVVSLTDRSHRPGGAVPGHDGRGRLQHVGHRLHAGLRRAAIRRGELGGLASRNVADLAKMPKGGRRAARWFTLEQGQATRTVYRDGLAGRISAAASVFDQIKLA